MHPCHNRCQPSPGSISTKARRVRSPATFPHRRPALVCTAFDEGRRAVRRLASEISQLKLQFSVLQFASPSRVISFARLPTAKTLTQGLNGMNHSGLRVDGQLVTKTFAATGVACRSRAEFGAPDRIRTCDLCLRRAALYPAELRVRAAGTGSTHRSGPRSGGTDTGFIADAAPCFNRAIGKDASRSDPVPDDREAEGPACGHSCARVGGPPSASRRRIASARHAPGRAAKPKRGGYPGLQARAHARATGGGERWMREWNGRGRTRGQLPFANRRRGASLPPATRRGGRRSRGRGVAVSRALRARGRSGARFILRRPSSGAARRLARGVRRGGRRSRRRGAAARAGARPPWRPPATGRR